MDSPDNRTSEQTWAGSVMKANDPAMRVQARFSTAGRACSVEVGGGRSEQSICRAADGPVWPPKQLSRPGRGKRPAGSSSPLTGLCSASLPREAVVNNWTAVRTVMERSASTGTARLILIAIAAHLDRRTGTAWPGTDRLSELANCHHDTVRKCLRDLEALGELEVMTQGGPGTSRIDKPNLYRILFLSEGGDLPSEDEDRAFTETSLREDGVEGEMSANSYRDCSPSSVGISSPLQSRSRNSCSLGETIGPPDAAVGGSASGDDDPKVSRRERLEQWDRQAELEHAEAAREVQEALQEAIEASEEDEQATSRSRARPVGNGRGTEGRLASGIQPAIAADGAVESRMAGRRPRKGSDEEGTRGVVRRPYAGQAKARRRRSKRHAQ
jgi:hypothetical protein